MNELKEINQETNNCLVVANEIKILANADYEKAAEALKGIKSLRKKIDDTFKPIIQKAHSAWKEAIVQSKKHTDPLDVAEGIVKNKISQYQLECEKKRIEEQKRLEEEEKKKLEQLAIEQAQYAETQEEAEEIIQQAIEEKPVVIVPKIEPKVAGISSRKVYRWRLSNEMQIKREYLMLDNTKINAVVRALGKNAEVAVGGIQVFEDNIISARS